MNISIDTIAEVKESWARGSESILYVPIRRSWFKEIFQDIFEKDWVLEKIKEFEKNEYGKIIFPMKYKIFNAFNGVSFWKFNVVIIGQDPYHSNISEAQGYSFLVPNELRVKPPTLSNIIKEVSDETKKKEINIYNWIKQGVLLLNCALTVRQKEPNSHIGYWEPITDEIIKTIAKRREGLVFMLWGNYAKKKEELICKRNGHLILQTSHPSPYSVNNGFSGCGHFIKANEFLKKMGKSDEELIDW